MTKRTQKDLVNIIDTSDQLDLPFAETYLNHNDNDPKNNYSNLISTVEMSNIFSCTPSKKFPKYHVRAFTPQRIPLRDNSEGIRSVLIFPGHSSAKAAADETDFEFLNFNDEVIFSIIIKLIANEKVHYSVEKGDNFEYLNPEFKTSYTLVTTFNKLIDETRKIGKEMSYQTIRKSLERLQSSTLEFEYSNQLKRISLIDRFDLFKGKKLADSKLLIQVSDLIADAIEENHNYYLYNHYELYRGGVNQIATSLKKEVIFHYRNLTTQKPLKLKVEDIYLNNFSFDLEATNSANKRKLTRSLKYLVESKVTEESIKAIYDDYRRECDPNFELTNREKDHLSEIEDSDSLDGVIYKILHLTNLRKDHPVLVQKLNELIEFLTEETKIKIFSSCRFCKVNGSEFLELYPNENLISQLKKTNFSTSQKLKNS